VPEGAAISISSTAGPGFEVSDFFFQFAQAVDDVGQLLKADKLAFGLAVGISRTAEDGCLVRDVAHDAGFRTDSGLIPDFQMPGNSRLRGDDAIVPEARAASETHLPHDEAMPANDDVMRHVDQIINLRALADDGGPERATVNGRIGADLDVVVDDDIADLQHFAVAAFVENITIAVGADDSAGVDADAMTDLALRINDDIGKEANIVAELAITADMVASHEHGADAQPHTLADDAIRPDVRRGINLRRRGDVRAWMNAGRVLVGRKKDRQQPGHGDSRIRHADENFFRRGDLAGHKNGGSLALFRDGQIRGFFSEGEVAVSGGVGRGKAGQYHRAVTNDFAVEPFRNLRNCEGHGLVDQE
jgi:hypothetical protein